MMKANSTIKSIAIVLIVLMIFSMAVTNAPLRAAATGSTFGYSTVGTGLDNDGAGWVAAQRVLMPNVAGAQVTMISFHVQAASGTAHVKCALYADNAGVPGALLGTTGEMAVTSAISWVNFTFATPISGTANTYYWLGYMMDAQIQFTVQGSGALAYVTKSGVSYPSFPNPFGTATGGYPNSINLYATYTVPEQPTPTPTPTSSPTPTPTSSPTPTPTSSPTPTPTSSPTPTPTSSPTPTPTPTPAPTSNPNSPNLVPMYPNGGGWGFGSNTITHFDTTVSHTNSLGSWRIDAWKGGANPYREIDCGSWTVHPGDHIVFRAWIKTGHSTVGNDNNAIVPNGGFLSLDFYGSTGSLLEYNSDDPRRLTQEDFNDINFVPWNSDWSFRQLDFIMPATVPDFYHNGAQRVVQEIAPILSCGSQQMPGGRQDEGQCWFADAELYINPSETTPTPTPPSPAEYWYLNIVSSTGGNTNPPAGNLKILVGNSQTVTATANPNYVFRYWLLNGTQYDTKATTTVTSYSSQTITLKPVFTYVSRWR